MQQVQERAEPATIESGSVRPTASEGWQVVVANAREEGQLLSRLSKTPLSV